MYFSIPDTTEVSGKSSSNQQSYTSFNIHINGIHHCSLRYSQLHTFNEELHRLLPKAMFDIATFPPKKFFSLSAKETDERRILLEHYLQSIIQNKYIITSSYFNEFFLNAQRDTFSSKSNDNQEKINLKICLLNNHELILENLSPNDNTSRVLDAYANKIQLQEDFISTNKKIYQKFLIILKKSYWDLNFDLQLINDRRARNLLFVQAQYEIEQSQYLYSSDIYQQLDILCQNKSFKDYLLLARTSKFYGHIFLRQCSILYPIDDLIKQKLCQCLLAIGDNEILCCLNLIEKKKSKEISFKVTRIRCWKVNRTKQETSISIEYLIKKDNLEWITIHTEQASLVSTCLQSMVDEILAKRTGSTSPPVSVPVASTTTEQPSLKVSNGLATRTVSDLEKFNNNDIFNRGDGDDDL